MSTELQICNMQVLFFATIISLCIFFVVYGITCLMKIPGLIRAQKTRISEQASSEENGQIAELRNAVNQIQLFTEMKRLERQQLSSDDAPSRLYPHLKTLGDDLRASLDEQRRCNERRCEQLQGRIDGCRDGLEVARATVKRREDRMKGDLVWTTLTEIRQGLEKDDAVGGEGPRRKMIEVINAVLKEFLKEAQQQLSEQENKIMLDMKKVFEQLPEDEKQFQNTIAVLNENAAEKTLVKKFQEFRENLQEMHELVNNLNFDVSLVNQTVENITGQLDEFYMKLELECQKNTDRSEEIECLQATAHEWDEKSSSMEEKCKQLTDVTHGIEDLLVVLDNALCNRQAAHTDMIPYSPSNDASVLNRMHGLESDKSPLFAMVQACQDKLAAMKDQIYLNTHGVQQSAELVLEELRLLMTSVKNGVETLKKNTIDMPDSKIQLDRTGLHRGDMLDTISERTEESQDDFDMDLHANGINETLAFFNRAAT